MRGRKLVVAGCSALLTLALVSFALLESYGERFHAVLTRGRWPVGAYRYDEATRSFALTPGIAKPMLDGSFHVKTHQLGYRIGEGADARAFRPGGVLAIGCSFTFGDEVEAEETFTAVAARTLGLDAYNFGVCSYSYASVLRQLEDLERRGILGELAPSIVVLGAGSWMPARSLSPFYPTPDLQLAHPYIALEGGVPAVADPPDAISVRHAIGFATTTSYFDGDRRDVPFDLRRRLLMLDTIPRVLLARLAQRTFANPVTPEQMYRFVLERISRITERIGAKLVVLNMPIYRQEAIVDPALVAAIDECHCATLVDGHRALARHDALGARLAHPDPSAHAAYAAALVEAVTTDREERREEAPGERGAARGALPPGDHGT